MRRALAPRFRFEGWELNNKRRSLADAAGSDVELTKREFALLTAFLEAPRRPLGRMRLMHVTRYPPVPDACACRCDDAGVRHRGEGEAATIVAIGSAVKAS